MLNRLSLSLVAVAVVASACGDSGTTTTTISSPSTTDAATNTAPTPTTAPQPKAAAAPPPTSFAEVSADFEAATAAIFTEGRAVADQFLSGDYETLYARFDAELASALSLDELVAGPAELQAQAPLGDRGLERAIQLSPMTRVYGVEIAWGEEAVTLNAFFNEANEISGIFVNPQLPLPRDPFEDYESQVAFRLPFDGLWFTFWGGDTAVENYHVVAPVQRHAFDFLIWKDGGTHRGDGSMVTDYWAYGQPVLAPTAGTVVTAVDGLPDQTPQTPGDVDNPAGNHVIIEVAGGEFLLIAHLQAGTLSVSEGEAVAMGQQIGLVGNSGSTTEPHIHIHLQDLPVFLVDGKGFPLEFTDYLANGELVERDQPLADQFVANR